MAYDPYGHNGPYKKMQIYFYFYKRIQMDKIKRFRAIGPPNHARIYVQQFDH